MQIIRDEELVGIMMIPLFSNYKINRCNIEGCTDKPTTICIHEQADFGLCEKHFIEGKKAGTMKLKLEFD